MRGEQVECELSSQHFHYLNMYSDDVILCKSINNNKK